MHFVIAWGLLNICKWVVCSHHRSPTGLLSVTSAPRLSGIKTQTAYCVHGNYNNAE